MGQHLGGWSPFADVGLSTQIERVEATVDSNLLLDDPIGAAPGATLRAWETTTLSVLLLRVGGGLRSPAFDDLPGRPRLQIQAGALVPTVRDSAVWSRSEVRMYPNPEGTVQDLDDEMQTRLAADWGKAWSAGLGLQFSLPLDEWDVRITASAQYMGRRISYAGRLERVFENRSSPGGIILIPDRPNAVLDLPVIVGASSADFTQHYLGPSLGLEAPFVRFGPLGLSAYLDGQVLLRIDAGAATATANPVQFLDSAARATTVGARFRIRSESYLMQFSGGLRLSFY